MAELNVSRESIKSFLSIKKGKFIIPDYQRPYSWDEEKCETLWDDIVNFSKNEKEEEYFLGTIVTHKDKEENIQIIDGQQRIISFLLLLRAFYKKLEEAESNEKIGEALKKIDNLKGAIEPCIWEVEKIYHRTEDRKKINILSEVIAQKDNDIFHTLVSEGSLNFDKQNKYHKNYSFFCSQCEKYAEKHLEWHPLISIILNKCIVLPINCDSQETALKIFTTLNDRGLPLNDSDIFKSEIYKTKNTDEEQKEFIAEWKELVEKLETDKIFLNNLFIYYSRYLGGQKENTRKDVEVSLRKFYKKDSYEKLKSPNLMGDLDTLATFWQAINRRDLDFENQKISLEAYKYLHCLHYYPNEHWRYITSVFYLTKKEDFNFKENFPKFLKRLTAFLYVKFIEQPTVNAIKDDTFKECKNLYQDRNYEMNIELEKYQDPPLQTRISNANALRIARGLILLHSYLNNKQKDLISFKFDIEHILPWQWKNYHGWIKEDANKYREKFGNKVAIDKKTNIKASNNNFKTKKEVYKKSEIAAVKELAQYPKDDWLKEDIEKREDQFSTTILKFFTENLSPSA